MCGCYQIKSEDNISGIEETKGTIIYLYFLLYILLYIAIAISE